MQGHNKHLYEFLGRQSIKLTIPVYQRNYDWKIEQCQRLLEDLITLTDVENKDSNHFFGCIVSLNLNKQEDLIIDGQQRITTVSLLLIAIYTLLCEQQLNEEDTFTKNYIIKEYLLQPDSKDQKLKLQHIKKDQKAYESLFKKDTMPIKGSSITNNYEFFLNQLKGKSIDELMSILNAYRRLDVIHVELDKNDDDPQLIFESLNSTGLALSEGDKIRNYILMNLLEDQNQYFEDYWVPISELTKNDVGSFVRTYLSMENKVIPKEANVYEVFKAFVKKSGKSRPEVLKDLYFYAKLYNKLLTSNLGDSETNQCVERLNRLETSVCRPFFLEILELNEKNNLSAEDIKSIFLTVESFIVRRMICDLATNNLNKIFLTLHRDIFNYDKSINDYVEKLKYNLTHRIGTNRFPNDDEFIEQFKKKDIYTMQAKNKKYLLERFENGGTKETHDDIFKKLDDGSYSIDHIMPQQLSYDWKRELGNEYNRIHEQWLHKIANLTITGYNSSYKNKSFSEKKNTENGYLNSGIRMNNFIAKFEKWDEAALEQRQDELMKLAKDTIWKFPETSFHIAANPTDSFTLSEYVESEEDVTGRKVVEYTYMGKEYPCKSWADLLYLLLTQIYKEDNSKIDYLLLEDQDDISKSSSGLLNYISLDEKKFYRGRKFADDMYVNVNQSAESILRCLSRLFEIYDLDPENLIITLKPEEYEQGDTE